MLSFLTENYSMILAKCAEHLMISFLSLGMGILVAVPLGIAIGMGYSWQFALFAVFAEGVIFILLSLTNVREAIFNAIPMSLKQAISCGIGLFIAFIGLQWAGHQRFP